MKRRLERSIGSLEQRVCAMSKHVDFFFDYVVTKEDFLRVAEIMYEDLTISTIWTDKMQGLSDSDKRHIRSMTLQDWHKSTLWYLRQRPHKLMFDPAEFDLKE